MDGVTVGVAVSATARRRSTIGMASLVLLALVAVICRPAIAPVMSGTPSRQQPSVPVPDTLLQYPGSRLQQVKLGPLDPGLDKRNLVLSLMFGTTDPPERVIAYYSQELRPHGEVSVCQTSTRRFPHGETLLLVRRKGHAPAMVSAARAPRSYLDVEVWHPDEKPGDELETKVIWVLYRPIPRW